MSLFSIRPAVLERSDQDLLVDFQDSQIQWLSTMGSGGQWGTQSVKESRPDASERTTEWVKKSQDDGEWGIEWCRAFIAEAESSSNSIDAVGDQSNPPKIPVAGLVLTGKAPDYVRSVLPQQDETQPFVYLTYLISNRHAGGLTKGAGAFLIDLAKDQVRQLGLNRLCVDCWSGNDRKLVKYYESQGFVVAGDFVVAEKNWACTVLQMRL